MEISEQAVKPQSEGWRIELTGEVIPYSEVWHSPDGRFHRCTPFFGDTTKPDRTICLFVPEMSF